MSLRDNEAHEIYVKLFKHLPTKQELTSFQFGYEIGYKNGMEIRIEENQ